MTNTDIESKREKIVKPIIKKIKNFEPETDLQVHIYWAKKPFNSTAEVIKYFTKKKLINPEEAAKEIAKG
jgi:hypothetical protein